MEYIKLKDLFTIKKGKKVEQINEKSEDSIRYIQIDDLRNNNNIKYCNNDSKYVIANKHDIIIAWDGANAGTVGYGLEGAIGSTLAILRKSTDEFISEFCGLFLKSKFDYLRDKCTGATIPHISKVSLEELKLPKFTLENQMKIVEVIKLSQELIDKRKAQIEALDELVKSQFIEMFGEPFSNAKGWRKKSLNKVVTDDCTISYGIVQTGEEPKEGIPVFRPVDIVKKKKPKLEELKKTTEEISNRYKKTILQGNELLMTVRANIGDVCVINEEFKGCNVGRGIVPIRVKDEVNTVFLKQQFESYRIQQELKALVKGITLIQLNMEDLREFMIIVPPIELQNQFAEFVNQVDKLKFEMEKSLKELEDNFNSLMQKAFNGQLFNK